MKKLTDERHKYRMARRDQVKNDREDVTSLYFDGKKTATRVLKQNSKTGRWSPSLAPGFDAVGVTDCAGGSEDK